MAQNQTSAVSCTVMVAFTAAVFALLCVQSKSSH